MIKAANCILIILILLLTAVFGLIAVLIIATEQPDSIFDQVTYNKNGTSLNKLNTTRPKSVATKLIVSTSSSLFNRSSDEGLEPTNSTTLRLVSLHKKLKLSNTEKVVSIGLGSNNSFYVAKVDGEVELFNWTTLEPSSIEHLNVSIHRMGLLSDSRVVIAEAHTKTLHLFDQNYKTVGKLDLAYQVLDLQVFNDSIYVLNQLADTISTYGAELAQRFTIALPKQGSCNFIEPVSEFVYVSCGSSLLKVSNVYFLKKPSMNWILIKDGELVAQTTISNTPYSLAIYYVSENKEIWAVHRGKEEIHVFDERLGLMYKMRSGSIENAVWTSIGVADGRIFALDYLSNTIKFFTLEK